MAWKMFRWRSVLLFDFDGTLTNAMPPLVDGLLACFRETWRGDLTRAQLVDLLYLNPKQMMQRFAGLTGWPV